MNRFTIRDIENLSGIKAHTLRIWEQRYSFLNPKRKDSNHRFYDNDDLKHILRISYLYHKGRKISNIAVLPKNEIIELINQENTALSNDFLIAQLLEASIDFDIDRFEKFLNFCFKKNTVENAMINVVYPFLNKIGLLWITEHIIPAQEHFSSNLIYRKLLSKIDAIDVVPKPNSKRILLFTPQNEHHEIPILFINYLLKNNGHRVIYFGRNTPLEDIEMYCALKQVDVLHFHLITHLTIIPINDYLNDLSSKFPDKKIIVSGPPARDVTISHSNVIKLMSVTQLLQYVKE